MKSKVLLGLGGLMVMALVCGCGGSKLVTTGFLSDYSKLETESDTSMRYFNPQNGLKNYTQFIVDPVAIHFHAGAKGIDTDNADLKTLQKYMYDALVKELSEGYGMVYQSGPGVARIRIALTDIKKSSVALNVLPQTKLIGLGLGSASMEAEVVDSVSGVQIGAVVESQVGERFSLDGLSTWGDAKGVMDRWAERFRKRLDEAHGR